MGKYLSTSHRHVQKTGVRTHIHTYTHTGGSQIAFEPVVHDDGRAVEIEIVPNDNIT